MLTNYSVSINKIQPVNNKQYRYGHKDYLIGRAFSHTKRRGESVARPILSSSYITDSRRLEIHPLPRYRLYDMSRLTCDRF